MYFPLHSSSCASSSFLFFPFDSFPTRQSLIDLLIKVLPHANLVLITSSGRHEKNRRLREEGVEQTTWKDCRCEVMRETRRKTTRQRCTLVLTKTCVKMHSSVRQTTHGEIEPSVPMNCLLIRLCFVASVHVVPFGNIQSLLTAEGNTGDKQFEILRKSDLPLIESH